MSVILEGQDYNQYLGKLLSFLDPILQSPGRGRFVRCWHAKTDGSAASIFHSNCDGKGPTVTIIKSGSYIFGGYTDVSWHSKYHFQNYRHHSLSLMVLPYKKCGDVHEKFDFLENARFKTLEHLLKTF